MKKKLLNLSFSALLFFILPLDSLMAQTNVPYWIETFTGPACNLTTTAPTSSDVQGYFNGANSGSWWGRNIFSTTGTACINNSADHVRFKYIFDLGWGTLVTPVVNNGIKEFHFTRNSASRRYYIYITNDTAANGLNWTLVVNLAPSANTILCQDTAILINSATAKRLKIVNLSAADSDIDSVWLTNFSAASTTPPTVVTRSALSITSSSALLGVTVSNEGSTTVSQRGVVYATTSNPTFANTKVSMGTGLGNVNTNVTGLTPGTQYHVRGFAINSTDTAFGADSTFTTVASVTTSPTITSFLPLAGNVGSTVTITGTNFNNVTKVWFGAAPASSFAVINNTTITAVVPDNAYLGNIAVATTNGYTIGRNYFRVNNPQNVIIGNNDQNSTYYFKKGKLYGVYSYDYDGGNQYRYCPVEMPSKGSLRGKTISQISNSGIHFIALASDNSVHAWGSNFRKQLGDSSASNKSRSVEITNKGDLRGKTIIQVLAGSYTSYALSSDGEVFSWGQDTMGALGNGAATNGIVWVPTSISSYGSLAGKTIVKLSKSVAANGYTNVFAIASDGTIHAWGGNAASCLGTGNSSVAEVPVNINQNGVLAGKTIVEIEGSNNSTLLIDNDGLVYAMGNGGSIGASGVQANPIAIDMLNGSSLYQKRALAVLTGKRGNYVHVLDTSGALHSIGNNVFGQLGIGSTSNATRPVLVEATTSSITGKTIVGLAHGDYCTYLLASDYTMHTFGGANGYGLMNGLNTPNVNKAIVINTLMPPTTDATNILISAITQNSATISCTAGSGVGRLIVIKAFNPIDTVAPANGVNYTAAAVQPGGSGMDTSAKVVYLGYGNSVNVSGLTSNRLYHVSIFEYDTFASPCRYNVFKLGTPLSGSFTTSSTLSLASLTTASSSSINSTSATLGGNVTASGGATVTERGVVYATTSNPTTANNKVQIGSGLGVFSQNVTGLTPSTTYHVRAYAINSVGTSYGADSVFTTLAAQVLSSVTTATPLFIATTQATLGGEVITDGGASVTERGIVYSTSINPTTSDTKVAMGTGLGIFSQAILGLSSSTIYHVRAYAINSVGTSYGADSTFKTATEINLPILITSTPSLITTNSANLGGNIINDGGTNITERGVVYSTELNPTVTNNKVAMGVGIGTYAQIVSGLLPNTTYHVRAYAFNTSKIAYGADTIFTTKPEPAKDVIIYTGFSPDGDGVNDGWVIENANELSGHTIIIYNVFGQEVFSQIGYDKVWDGTVDGNLVPSGEYYYMIKGDKVNKKGALLIKTTK